ncbi:MAG TPA: IclR family transcriptional regulator C-terminal domain-containing protein [Vineibacter sp.]|nr:IclR family transcriptional regulator C-terminal domain-containing protein [Vineibacter sp.]
MGRLRQQDAEKRAESDHGPDFSEALARGLSVITAFDADHRQLTLSDIARAIDLPRATARRALYTLTRLGYVEMEGRLFRLAPKILRLASAYLTSNLVSRVLQPACERICEMVDATCSVAVLDGDEVVMVARASPVRPISVGLGVGYRLPAFCSALGRVMLSTLPDDRLDAFFKRLKPVQATAQTVTDKARLRQAIFDVRANGFALVDQEAEVGFRSLAVPLVRYDGVPVAAMNLGTQIERVSLDTMRNDYLPVLRRESARLKEQLI